MRDLAKRIRRQLDRDKGLSLPRLAEKGLAYARQLSTAHWYLRNVDEVGEGVRTEGRPRIDNRGFMRLGDGTLLRSINVPVELATGETGTLLLGREVFVNYGVSIGAMGSITIGDHVNVGPYVMIIDSEFHDLYDRARLPAPRPVVIEDHAWLGAKASILPGVRVGKNAVVGTGAVVTVDVPDYAVVAGVPARVIKRLDPSRFASA